MKLLLQSFAIVVLLLSACGRPTADTAAKEQTEKKERTPKVAADVLGKYSEKLNLTEEQKAKVATIVADYGFDEADAAGQKEIRRKVLAELKQNNFLTAEQLTTLEALENARQEKRKAKGRK